MAKFVLIYHGGGMPENPADVEKVMQAWGAWYAQLGAAVVDPGNPASNTRKIAPDGSVSEDPTGPSGYTILQADSMDQAVEMAKACPVLAGGASIQVAETFDVM